MKNNKMYSGYRYPSKIISHTVPKTFHWAGSKEKIKILASKIGVKWMNGQGISSPYPATN